MAKPEYFANLTGRDFSSAAFERINDYYQSLLISGRLALYRRLGGAYWRGYWSGGQLGQDGDQGEFTMMDVNHFRNILQHMMSMTITQRPAFEPRATNTDYKSKAQTIVARGVLDYYNREKGMGDAVEDNTEGGLVFGESETVADWDSWAGQDYMANPAGGATIKEGDVVFKTFGPIDCIRDVSLTSAKGMKWRFYRDFVNRYDLIARFPEARERILALEMGPAAMANRWLSPWTWKDGDIVPVYIFYHDRTPSVPGGRFALLIDKEMPLMDGGLPYDTFPGYRLAAAEQKGTPFGYSVSFDLLCIQEAIDILYSTVVTNQASFGVQNILLPNGSNISVQQLVDGLNAIFYDPNRGKPEALNLTSTPTEIFNMIERLERVMEILSGVNSVSRGDPQASLKSGAALALVQSMAIQFNSGLQKAYARQAENIATAVIKIMAKFPKTKRIVEIAGKANRTYLKEFTAADLSGISRVTVDLGNPLARTTAGKVQMAEDLLANKLIETGDQYIQVLTTGTLEPLIEGKQAELMLIASENEMMSNGQKPTVAVTDDHALHIREHKPVLADPEARKNPAVVVALTEHETEHIRMLEQLSISNPNLLIALGQQPVQAPAPPPLPGVPGAPGASKTLDATPAVVKAATGVKGPAMPKDALTGEPAPAPLPVSAA